MPIGLYIGWVGASLLIVLLVANWFVPQSFPEGTANENNRPVIRIASMQQPPERIVIDTNQPTLIPPPTQFAEVASDERPLPPAQLYASATRRPTVIDVDKKRSKATKRQVNEFAPRQASSSRTTAVVSGKAATTVPPNRLSFANIMSGQIVRDLFNLH